MADGPFGTANSALGQLLARRVNHGKLELRGTGMISAVLIA
jgi:hypothetical protein